MKKFILFLFVIFFCTSVANAQITIKWQNPQPAGSFSYSSCFLNSSTGWIIGDGTVLKTTDNGGTWSTTFLDPFFHRLASVSFLNENFGILTGSDCAYKSTNGGNNWIQMNLDTFPGYWWNSSCMITETTGWIAGYNVLKTTNGGQNWVSKYAAQEYRSFRSIYFINEMKGWAAGDLGYIRTTNGGEDWIFTEMPDLRKVYFTTETTGWMCGGGFWKSTDEGINWNLQNDITGIVDFYFSSVNKGWAAKYSGEIFETSDGGNNWYVQSNTGSENISVYLDSSFNGWAIGQHGSIKKTLNGGEDWISLDSRFTNKSVNSVCFISEFNGWAVGESGIIFNTTNGGINWNAQQSSLSTWFNAVRFVNNSTGWAAGTEIVKTTNGGVNWITQPTEINEVRSISFISPYTGWMAGGTKVIKTTDSGENWITVLESDQLNLKTVFFISPQTGWTAGKYGKILKTTNGGTDWTEGVFPDDYAILYSVYFSSESTGYAVGGLGGGKIYKTTNGGDLWISMPYERTQTSEPLSIFFTDNNNGWVAGNMGNLMKTTDGGNNWEYQSIGVIYNLYSVFFASENIGWVVGEGGTIVKISDGSQQPVSSDDIFGSNNVLKNSTNLYYTQSLKNVHWNISNYDSTNAEMISDPHSDSVYVFSGNKYGHFVLYLSSPDSLLNSKHVYIDNPMPVELSNFISMVSANDVTLKWSTSSEINNSGFEIERSNVKGHTSNEWSKVGFVRGSGTSTDIHNYEFTEKSLNSGKYKYRLKQIDFNGNFEYFELAEEVIIGIPIKYNLSQNYPNPFNPITNLEFGIPELGFVTLKIYDVIGRELITLVNENKEPGYYKVKFDASNLSSGVYFYRMTAGDFVTVKKFVIQK